MSENNIYEITQMMSNKNMIEHDLQEAAGLVLNLFQEKYVNRINSAVRQKHINCCENPPKEVHLLNALKPFFPQENHGQMDRVIDTLLMMKTFENIGTEIQSVKTQDTVYAASAGPTPPSDPMAGSIHDDGIYEIDSRCMSRRQNQGDPLLPIIMLMAMQGLK